jgi:hypothetical protein
VLLTLVLGSWRCATAQPGGQPGAALTLSQTIVLPAMQGGFNHMSVDAARQRLFAAAPTNGTLEVVDLRTGQPLRSIPGDKPAAARYAPEFDQLYVSRGQHVVLYSGDSLDAVTTIDLGSNMDELQYDARTHRLYAGCMSPGHTGIAVIAIPEGKLLGVIALPGKPQGIAVEQHGTRLFANMPTLRQVAVADTERRTLLSAWPLSGAEGNTPIALDEIHHRLFIGGRKPAQLLVFDTANGRLITRLDTDHDADDLFYDAVRRRIYISCGEGFLDVLQQRDADRYVMRDRLPTLAGARTSTFSPALNRFILGIPRRPEHPAELRIYEALRSYPLHR